MKVKEFAEQIAKEIEGRLDGVKATTTETMKTNGVILNGVLLRKDGERIAPVLFVDALFKCFKKGELTMPDVLEKLIEEYKGLSPYAITAIEECKILARRIE